MARKKKSWDKKSYDKRDSTKSQRRDVEIADSAEKNFYDRRGKMEVKSKANDWTWYAHNPELIKAYASYPFGVKVGTLLQGMPANFGTVAVPGVMSLYFSPACGGAQTPTDAVTQAARNIYSFVRHANSGHSNYDAPDLFMYLLAMDSVYMFHAYIKRLYGMLLDYTPLNKYYPEALIRANGFDPDDMRQHLTDLYGFINEYAVRVGSMAVPNSMSYMRRHSWMCEGIYLDGSAAKSQTYMYVPYEFYTFKVDGDPAVGQLNKLSYFDPRTQIPGSLSFEDIVSLGNELLTPILEQEDFNIMSGDILKAFGADGIVKLTGIDQFYSVIPAYDQEVLMQMENSVLCAADIDTHVFQSTAIGGGYLYTQGYFANHNANIYFPQETTAETITAATGFNAFMNLMMGGRCILNYHVPDVTPEMVMVSTRLTNTLSIPANASWAMIPGGISWPTAPADCTTVGSEYVTCARIWYYQMKGGLKSHVIVSNMPVGGDDTGTRIIYYQINKLGALSTFDWHPRIAVIDATLSASGTLSSGGSAEFAVQDVDNYTVIDSINLENMSKAAILSEFSVPQMGLFASKL